MAAVTWTRFASISRFSSTSRGRRTFSKSVAGDEVVVGHAWDLHEGIHDCWANAAETPPNQIFAYGICFWCFDGHLTRVPEPAQYRFVVHEAPTVFIKWSKFLYNLQEYVLNSDRKKCYLTNTLTKRNIWRLSVEVCTIWRETKT